MQVLHWSPPYDYRVSYKSRGGGGKGGKIPGRLHLPDRAVDLQTGHGDYPDKT